MSHLMDIGYENILEDFKHNRSGRIRRQVRNVLNLVDLPKNMNVLEVGVATGKFTSIFSRNNKIYAFDISLENLKRAGRSVADMGCAGNLCCISGNCSKMPFRNSSFDRILAIDIIEHLSDKVFDLFCRETHRLLKSGCYFYIYTPNLLHPYELSRPFRPIMRREHIGVRTRANICRILKMNGLIIEKSYFNNFFRRISIKAKKL